MKAESNLSSQPLGGLPPKEMTLASEGSRCLRVVGTFKGCGSHISSYPLILGFFWLWS